MIRVNKEILVRETFPDDTLLVKFDQFRLIFNQDVEIIWNYEEDSELFMLYCLVKQLQGKNNKISLVLPYIPNARMDRIKKEESYVFTLKYFAEIINLLDFENVTVLDPHSDVSLALINKVRIDDPARFINEAISEIKLESKGIDPLAFYPDNGAAKRYVDMVKLPWCYGEKKRVWGTGKIIGFEVKGFALDDIPNKPIMIVDDICSYGGTAYYAALELKKLGAKDIYFYISHCEHSILKGELIKSNLIKKIFTTDSIFRKEHELIKVLKYV